MVLRTPSVLAIAGLDPSGGAGLLLDSRVISALGAHVCAVATAVVPQNTRRVLSIEPVPSAVLEAQMDAVLEDADVRAVKIGMLPGAESAQAIAGRLRLLAERGVPIVYDTVFASSSGATFLEKAEVQQVVNALAPLCALLTPNLHEAQALCGFELRSRRDVERAALLIAQRFGARQVLVKGGHAHSIDAESATDFLWNGSRIVAFASLRLPMRGVEDEVRGTGCALSSATAALLARGLSMEEAVAQAKSHLSAWIARAQSMGQGRRVMVKVEAHHRTQN